MENRIESYHQLRTTIAQVNGKKELTGRTLTWTWQSVIIVAD